MSIIKESLRLPKTLSKSQITGAMWGDGLYVADDIKKSVGYTSYKGSYWSNGAGGISNRGAMMFICDVVLGKMDVPTYRISEPRKGYHSI